MSPRISFWEKIYVENHYPVVIIGAGIVGLSTALSILEKEPKTPILILEKEPISRGASTRNAGFACFGSPSELLDDLQTRSELDVFSTVADRVKGLEKLKKRIDPLSMDYHQVGGYEVYYDEYKYQKCLDSIAYLNKKIELYTGYKNTFQPIDQQDKKGMLGNAKLISNSFEGYLHPGKMVRALEQCLTNYKVNIIKGANVAALEDDENQCNVRLENIGIISCNTCIVAVNGFANSLLNNLELTPARNQVLLSYPLKNLKIKGTYHHDRGYVYWRNIEDRLLIGGMRNKAEVVESTENFGTTELITSELKSFVDNNIRQGVNFEYAWSGIMGVGSTKSPIVKRVRKHIIVAARLGGMGVAIGSLVGEKAAQLTLC